MRGSPWHSQHAHTSPGLGRCGWGPPQSSGVVWALFTREKGTHLCPAELLCHRTAVARPTKAGLSHSRGTAASFVPHGRPESAGTASEAVHGERQGLCGAAKRAEFSRSSITGVRRSLLAGYLLGGVPRAYYVTVGARGLAQKARTCRNCGASSSASAPEGTATQWIQSSDLSSSVEGAPPLPPLH